MANQFRPLLYFGIALWGISFGGVSTLLQKDIADRTGDNSDVAQSMFVTVFNLAIAIGGITGGVLLEKLGASSFPGQLYYSQRLYFFVCQIENLQAQKKHW